MIYNVRLDKMMNSPEDINDKGDTQFRIKIMPQVDLTWIKQFEEAYNASKSNVWRKVQVQNTYIEISCHHSELVDSHLPSIKNAINTANAVCQKMHEAYEKNRQEAIEKEKSEKKAKQDILDNLNLNLE
ncbi:hypothetical protein [Oceanimonas baumannii]|uniref:Uncharacterized protein n=1 Tax=Oceanimonas baumannii TaxID=129578 RepID=A0A235CH40_9GAMM|nr:hypothetical protein [Oceanimonas baumannii]OYD23155.1 hypothetical protein B6S09_13960 [Oceanimonas baumannii]TDW53488.1 hypothetical protein LY04_03620 [Oceanimonas baumannii]